MSNGVNKYVFIGGFLCATAVSWLIKVGMRNYNSTIESSSGKVEGISHDNKSANITSTSVPYANGKLELGISPTQHVYNVGIFDRGSGNIDYFQITQHFNLFSMKHDKIKTNIPVQISVVFNNEYGRSISNLSQTDGKQLTFGPGGFGSLDTLLSTNAGAADFTLPAETEYLIGTENRKTLIRVTPNSLKPFELFYLNNNHNWQSNPFPLLMYDGNVLPSHMITK